MPHVLQKHVREVLKVSHELARPLGIDVSITFGRHPHLVLDGRGQHRTVPLAQGSRCGG
ncbi:hypothetical protein K32_24310 [Kaistia sp. 32K]|uniref:hypothetical protein n=1 Tax=Kaistia sp. 32K TaxID=2795690 RepID=UPI0019164D10|nr:hypothetical protein [Kaistia sp. 32K]BCP53814.1 hypothetical protein K32_24310 [Kaistia sp. 32K]